MVCFNVQPSIGRIPIAATLRDIADRLGVSTQAVSLALNKSAEAGRVSPELRERAVALARELGYRPNRLARALVHGRSHFVGLLMLAPVEPPYVEALRGVDDEATALGRSVLMCGAYEQGNAQRQLETFTENQVDGIIAVASSTVGLTDEVLARKPEGTPLVSINREISAPDVLSIVMDNQGAMQQATEHLLRLGHRRIAYLDVPGQAALPSRPPLQSSTERREGYLAAMAQAGLEPVVVSLEMLYAEQRVEAAYHAARELLKGPPRRTGQRGRRASSAARARGAGAPTAFCAVTDWEALGALRACADLGLKVPEEVAIFGFDDRELGRWTQPALSTVRPAFHEAGRLAVRRLLEWEGGAEASVCRLDCKLVFRASAPEALEA